MTQTPHNYLYHALDHHHYHTSSSPLLPHSNFNMINPSTNLTSVPSSQNFVSMKIRFPLDIQVLEIFVAVFVFVAIHSLRQRKRQGLPVWPFLGMLPSLVAGLQIDMYEWISVVLCRQNGTFTFKGPWFSNLNCVVTSDPRNIEHLLKSKFTNFPKGAYFRNTIRDLLGDGIFNADDVCWQRQRKTASLEFHSAKFRKLTTESLLELVHSRLLPVLEDSVRSSASIDLQDVLLRLTFDNVCMIAFGVDPGCLRLGLPEIPFARAFEDATQATILRFVTPTCLWKAMRHLNVGPERKLKVSIMGVDKFANEVIATRKKELALQSDDEKNKRSDLLTTFMGLKDEDGQPFSDTFLRDICVNFILAGRDTSSVALSWFFWLLDQNPVVEHMILEEICKVVGGREGEKEGDGLIFKPEEVKKMEYLQAALSEALRLYPSVPERWLRDGRFVSESAYKFTAFNGGPRLCLGKDFAYYQMKFAAASIIYRYHVKVVKDHPVEPKLALTMYMKHGLKVNLIRRHESDLQKYK